MNPDLVRWMLLMGQLDSPTTEDEEVIYKLYYKFFSEAMPKAKFLIPLDAASEFKGDSQEGNSFVLEKDSSFNIPVKEGKMAEILFQYLLIGNVCEWSLMKNGMA